MVPLPQEGHFFSGGSLIFKEHHERLAENLLILLHGVGSNELSMEQIAPAFDPRFVVLSVRSPIAEKVTFTDA